MEKRKAFTLLELTVATVISSFVLLSMASIYTAANKHIFQSYRSDSVKSGVSLSMRAIRNIMTQATLIDLPAYGSTGSKLAVAINVDPLSGCYPIVNSANYSGAPAPSWHLFCVDTSNSSNYKLYYHHGNYGGSCTCPGTCAPNTTAATMACGSSGGMLLAQYLDSASVSSVFSRTAGDVQGHNAVRVKLHSLWNTGSALNRTQRPVDYRLDGIFSVSAGRTW